MIQVSTGTLGPGVKQSKRGAWYLIYDGECRFCARWIALLRSWDRAQRLRYVPFQEAAELIRLPFIPRDALEQAMHLVSPDGAIFPGAAALPALLRLVPGGWLFAWMFSIPGVSWLAARVYRVIARNRHKLGCGSSTCRLGGQ